MDGLLSTGPTAKFVLAPGSVAHAPIAWDCVGYDPSAKRAAPGGDRANQASGDSLWGSKPAPASVALPKPPPLAPGSYHLVIELPTPSMSYRTGTAEPLTRPTTRATVSVTR